jgi:outer membrane protein
MNRFSHIVLAVTAALLLATSSAHAETLLSLEDAIALSLTNNPDIAVAGFAPRKAEAEIRAQQGAFDPVFSLSGGIGRDKTPQSAFAIGPFRNQATAEARLAGRLSLGTEYALSYGTTYRETDSPATKTSSTGYVELELRQPLLRGFGRDVNNAGINIARGNERIAELGFLRKTEGALLATIDAYWRLVRAHKSLAVARESLQLAERLVQRTQARVAAGDLPTVELTQARASVASREEAVILGEAEVGNANDALARQLAADPRAVFDASYVPTDEPTADALAFRQPTLVTEALHNRADLRAARQGVTNAEIALAAAQNLRRPDLSAVASAGVGGLDSQWRSAQSELANEIDDQHRWSVGLVFSMPIGNRSADGVYQKARHGVEEAKAALRSLELQVTEEVRSALRNLQASAKRVEATRRASELAREQLVAGEKRLGTGLSTAFEVLRLQTDLAAAQNAEIAAMIAYRTNIVRVQLATGGLFHQYVKGV